MKKVAVVCGLVLITLGLILFYLYNLTEKMQTTSYKEIINKLVDRETYTWEISWDEMVFEWDFSEKEDMIIAVWPHYDWGIPSLSDEPTGMYLPPNSSQWFEDVKRLKVNVTNLNYGTFTLIEIYYVYLPTKPGTPYVFQDYFGIINDTGALSLDGTYPKAGTIDGKGVVHLGKAKTSGTYRITFSMEPLDVMDEKIIEDNRTVPWPHEISPPDRIRLYKSGELTIHPYRSLFLLMAGTLAIALGGIILLKSRYATRRRHYRLGKRFHQALSIK
ncbi:MAG: hypothetical protein QW791_05830 [Candidatus Bathyarchaeia archaeon]